MTSKLQPSDFSHHALLPVRRLLPPSTIGDVLADLGPIGSRSIPAFRSAFIRFGWSEANLPDDRAIAEVLYKYDATKMTYSYRITEVAVEVLPVTNYSSHLTVKPLDGGGSLVEWRGAFYRGYPNNDPPPELNDEAAIAAVTGVYQEGLDALVDRFGAPQS